MRSARVKSPPKPPAPRAAKPPAPVVAAPAPAPQAPLPPLMTIKEVAWALHVGERTVYQYLKDGLLERRKLGSQTMRIPRQSFAEVHGRAGRMSITANTPEFNWDRRLRRTAAHWICSGPT